MTLSAWIKPILFATFLFVAPLLMPPTLTAPSGGEAQAAEQMAEKIKWRFPVSWGTGFRLFSDIGERIVDNVNTASGGRLELELFWAGELVPGGQVLDAVSSGAAEAGWTSAIYYKGKNIALAAMAEIPFGPELEAYEGWYLFGGGLELLQKLMDKFEVHAVAPCGGAAEEFSNWFKFEVTGPESIKGKKLRYSGLGGNVMNNAGAEVIMMPGSEAYLAMDRGLLEGGEWCCPYSDTTAGFHEVADYLYYPGWHQQGDPLVLIVNQKAWDALPPDLQRIVEMACMDASLYNALEWRSLQGEGFKILKKKGTKIKRYPQEYLDFVRQKTKETMAQLSAESEEFAEVYNSFKDFYVNHWGPWREVAPLFPEDVLWHDEVPQWE